MVIVSPIIIIVRDIQVDRKIPPPRTTSVGVCLEICRHLVWRCDSSACGLGGCGIFHHPFTNPFPCPIQPQTRPPYFCLAFVPPSFQPSARRILGFPLRKKQHGAVPVLDSLCLKSKILSVGKVDVVLLYTALGCRCYMRKPMSSRAARRAIPAGEVEGLKACGTYVTTHALVDTSWESPSAA